MEERLKEYYIDNTTSVDRVLTLAKETTCGVFTLDTEFSQIIPANTEAVIEFPSDGTYKVYLDGELEENYANFFLNLFNSLIVYTAPALCGGADYSCTTKSRCTEEEVNILINALSKAVLYIADNDPTYQEAAQIAFTKIRCSAKSTWDGLERQENYIGTSDTDFLTKIELSHIYLELYKVDLDNADPSDYDALKVLYNYDTIIRCISKLGIKDCEPVLNPGVAHTYTFSVAPISIPLGEATDVTVTYKFTPNEDTFVAILDTNVPNVDILQFNGFTYNQIVSGATLADTYFITYSYIKGGVTLQNTVQMSTTANPPQWYGGETTTADFADVGGVAYVSSIKAAILNIAPEYKDTSDGTSTNVNTTGKYIWWITESPIEFFVGGFKIPTGPWAETCDPDSYAIIYKQVLTTMEDGITQVPMYHYRTCPLQNLYGQTLEYILKE